MYDIPPKYLNSWLNEQSFLTKKLQQKTGDAHLELLSQIWKPESWWDRYVLGVSGSNILQRDIVMYSQNIPCWFARTIIPSDTYHKNQDLFNRLKSQLLGTILFESNVVTRFSFISYAINQLNIEYHWINRNLSCNKNILWGRRSTFMVNDTYPLYLIEIFLPTFERVLLCK